LVCGFAATDAEERLDAYFLTFMFFTYEPFSSLRRVGQQNGGRLATDEAIPTLLTPLLRRRLKKKSIITVHAKPQTIHRVLTLAPSHKLGYPTPDPQHSDGIEVRQSRAGVGGTLAAEMVTSMFLNCPETETSRIIYRQLG
jgi:hypothetical protein